MAWFRNISARRRDVRRTLHKPTLAHALSVNPRELFWAVLFAVTLVVVAGSITIGGSTRAQFAVGQSLVSPVVARVNFRAVDVAATNAKKKAAAEREPAVYSPNPAFTTYANEQFAMLQRLAGDESAKTIDQVPEKLRVSLELTQPGLDVLREWIVKGQPTPAWTAVVESFMDGMANLAILPPDRAKEEIDERRPALKIRIQHPRAGEQDRYRNEILNPSADAEPIRERLNELTRDKFPKPLPRTVVALMMQDIQRVPVYVPNDDLTKQRRAERYAREPDVEKIFEADDVFIPAGKQLEPADVELLARERETYEENLSKDHPFYPWLTRLGQLGMVAVVAVSLWGYILAYNPRVAQNPIRGLALTGLLLLALLVAVSATAAYPRLTVMTAAFPTMIAGMVLAIAYDRRFALAVASLLAVLVVFALGLGVDFGMVLLVGCGVAIGQLDELRTRSKLLLTGVWAGLAMAITVAVVGLATRPLHLPHQLDQIFLDSRTALGTAVAAGLLVQGLLPAIERVFRVTTAMSLKELNDASNPLLRRLAQEAPGTYQHSLRMADMAEAAADAVHGNAPLCKVGAMYHDIGKINKPQYFVENQGGGPNRHEKLSPAMSLLIIVGHVKDGIELAREYHLPASVRQFIETHHGTTLVEYFYHAARQQSDAQDAPLPSEYEYRYPGPKPQTREAAILMICDGVEGAARTLPDPTPQRLESLVQRLAQKRLMDGQFDECGITLQELHTIEQSISKTLTAMYHGRIKYPTDEPLPGEPRPTPQPAAAPGTTH
ncbi:MAG: HDIG domain-containing protein [Planctomycetes bacterium]|nr:HDIG domain-containing protein [Planctomycetota bacterium]